MDKEENILLAKWLNHTITPEELNILEQEVDLEALSQTLDRQKTFDLELESPETMWKNFEQKISSEAKNTVSKSPAPKINLKKRLLAIIAIFAVGIIGFLVYNSLTTPTEIKTQPKQRVTRELADGTKIQVSPDSKVSYFEKNWETKREIELKGQAFFQVSKGVPFSVKTKAGLVEVLGTSFDIWSSESFMKVQCFEGSVRVTHPKSGKSETITIGQQINLNKEALGTVENFNGNNPGWIEKNQQIYKSIPVALVINDIRRFLEIEVNTGSLNIENQFSGLIPFNSPEETARYLAESMGWKYIVNENVIQFSN